jgi:hypothetical protein
MVGLQLWGLGIHFWTVRIAWHADGFLGAFLALIMPTVAEAWWVFKLAKGAGTFWNPYSSMIAIYLGAWIILAGVMLTLTKLVGRKSE